MAQNILLLLYLAVYNDTKYTALLLPPAADDTKCTAFIVPNGV